jgi:copper chaperone
MTELKVDGMTCGGCAAAVKKAVEKAAPGATASVDLPTGTVRVTGAADLAAVKQAIRVAGFETV